MPFRYSYIGNKKQILPGVYVRGALKVTLMSSKGFFEFYINLEFNLSFPRLSSSLWEAFFESYLCKKASTS